MKIVVSKDFIKRDLNCEKDQRRNSNYIRELFNMSKKDEFTIDDQTWSDLSMDNVFNKLDRTYSSYGESSLYKMLRNPILNKDALKNRGQLIDLFESNIELTVNLRKVFFEMCYDKKNILLDMIKNLKSENKFKYYIYSILSLIPIILICSAILLKQPKIIIGLLIYVLLSMYIHMKEQEQINLMGIIYLRDLITQSKKISNINNTELANYNLKINKILSKLKFIDKSSYILNFITAFEGILETLLIPFLVEERIYYKINEQVMKYKDEIVDLYSLIGEIDALISIALYKTNTKNTCTTPKFIDKTYLKVVNGVHPLLDSPVANSIEINKKGIVLTGTNMSGKSTFLRMISINILLAQTFYFALGDEYEGSFFNLISSISPKDDIESGKSYYLSEAESILRILNKLDKKIPVFCSIDEIFRGTNPIERISSSIEILNYIQNHKAICIVSTHDKELSEMLKNDYEFYYFSENVDDKNGLSFDYKLKKGVSKTRNAIKLLDYMGYPKEIIQNAYKRIENMEKFI